MLKKPIYVNVAESEKPQEFHAQPEETVLLEPGNYFISFQIVDCNEKALEEYLQIPEPERDRSKMRLSTLLYFKSSYTRKAALGKMEYCPVNIGMVVKGLEKISRMRQKMPPRHLRGIFGLQPEAVVAPAAVLLFPFVAVFVHPTAVFISNHSSVIKGNLLVGLLGLGRF